MYIHVVGWKLKEGMSDAEAAQRKADMKTHFEGLVGHIPEIASLKFITAPLAGSDFDVCLVSTHHHEEDIKKYGAHPKHVEAVEKYLKPYTTGRICVNYAD